MACCAQVSQVKMFTTGGGSARTTFVHRRRQNQEMIVPFSCFNLFVISN